MSVTVKVAAVSDSKVVVLATSSDLACVAGLPDPARDTAVTDLVGVAAVSGTA